MKGIILLANGFEDVEAIATIDVLRRSKIDVDTVTLNKDLFVITSSNLKVLANYYIENVNFENYDFLIIPGGKAVFNIWKNYYKLDQIIEVFIKKGLLVAAICAAPMLLNNFLDWYDFTYFKGCQEEINHGNYINNPVVVSKNIITARSMYYSNDFALEIIKYLQSTSQANLVEKQIKSL